MLSFVFCVYRFDFDIDGFAIMIDFWQQLSKVFIYSYGCQHIHNSEREGVLC